MARRVLAVLAGAGLAAAWYWLLAWAIGGLDFNGLM